MSENLYLELLKKSLLGELYWENDVRLLYLRKCIGNEDVYAEQTLLRIDTERPGMSQEYRAGLATGRFIDDRLENLGYPHTMIGRARLENIEFCLNAILRDNTSGDVMECGVWRGGATVFMRGFLKSRGVSDRLVWVADSFQGLPVPTLPQDPDLSAGRYPALAISQETVTELFARYGLLDDQVHFLKGWFRDTLPAAPVSRLALLRFDADLYESTMDVLNALYNKVSPGGWVIVDDYNCIEACRQAVDEYRDRHGIVAPIERIDWTGVYWRKE